MVLQWASGREEKREKERGREKEGAQSSETREAAAWECTVSLFSLEGPQNTANTQIRTETSEGKNGEGDECLSRHPDFFPSQVSPEPTCYDPFPLHHAWNLGEKPKVGGMGKLGGETLFSVNDRKGHRRC